MPNSCHSCQGCQSDRIISLSAQCNDDCSISLNEHEYYGYPLNFLGISRKYDCISFQYCADCGTIQGKWPLPPTPLDLYDPEDEEFADALEAIETIEAEANGDIGAEADNPV